MLTDSSRTTYWATTNPYTDVNSKQWYNNAISTLTKAGILDGYNDGSFRPDNPISRAEFATMAVRFYNKTYTGSDLFTDISDSWARQYVNTAASVGLIEGYPDGTFKPNSSITRAEAITIINRVLERKPVQQHLLKEMVTWSDNMDAKVWYYADVQEATNSHTYTVEKATDGSSYEIWKTIQPVRDWGSFETAWAKAAAN